MKLYSGDLSPYSARVRMQIYAKGITDITLEPSETVDLSSILVDISGEVLRRRKIGLECG
jgi:hypothetical protein